MSSGKQYYFDLSDEIRQSVAKKRVDDLSSFPLSLYTFYMELMSEYTVDYGIRLLISNSDDSYDV
jgi:hypothetical protein